jgi:hypothetical protein
MTALQQGSVSTWWKKTAFALLFSNAIAWSGTPVQDMSKTTLGIDYSGLVRGEDLTKATMSGLENVHVLNVRYAPVPYVMGTIGCGMASYSVDSAKHSRFGGGFWVTPSVGLDCYTPAFIYNLFKVTAGIKGYYLYSTNENATERYTGIFLTPGAGIVFTATRQLDLEAGARALMISGNIEREGKAAGEFSNKEQVRGYFSLLLHSPDEGVYCDIAVDVSPSISSDWSRGPAEAGVSLSIGYLLRKSKEDVDPKTEAAFPKYKEAIKRAGELEHEFNNDSLSTQTKKALQKQ